MALTAMWVEARSRWVCLSEMSHRGGLDRRWRIACVVSAAWLLPAVTAGCWSSTSSTSLKSATNVVLVGDSLATEAAPFLTGLVQSRTLVPNVFPGTAPCDWLDKDLKITSDSVVVVSFIGNSTTACMADGAGGFLAGQAVVEKYETDVATLIEQARAVGAPVLVVGQPVRSDPGPTQDIAAGLDSVYNEFAKADDVQIVDAGAAVENPDGTFAHELPCLDNEMACDVSGNNVVRSDDGVHFCPGSPPDGPCPTYASGAFRFAKAIADAIITS